METCGDGWWTEDGAVAGVLRALSAWLVGTRSRSFAEDAAAVLSPAERASEMAGLCAGGGSAGGVGGCGLQRRGRRRLNRGGGGAGGGVAA